MRRPLAAIAIVCGLGAAQTAASQGTGLPPVPVEEASYHVPSFHNEYVTLLKVDIPAKSKSDYHTHSKDQIGVVLDDYPPEAYSVKLGQAPDAPRGVGPGEVSYSTYYKTPVTHQAINPGVLDAQIIGIILDSPKPYGFTPLARDAAYTQAFDNDRARGWRLALQPGQSAPMITQKAPGMRVVVAGGRIAEITPDGRERDKALMKRDFFWQDPGAARAVRNIGTTRVEIVEFELK